MTNEEKLQEIATEIENCRICKIGKSGKAVPGEGNPSAQIMFIGEAPGRQESLSGRPFIGRSGKLLRDSIRSIGLKEEDVFITSPVKYLPDRGTPTDEDIRHGMIHLQKQFDVIRPKIIVLLGSVATKGVLGQKIPVMLRHGEIVEENDFKYFFTIHPAAVIRFQKNRRIFEEDFVKLKEIVGVAD